MKDTWLPQRTSIRMLALAARVPEALQLALGRPLLLSQR